jgi:hypothetical protein
VKVMQGIWETMLANSTVAQKALCVCVGGAALLLNHCIIVCVWRWRVRQLKELMSILWYVNCLSRQDTALCSSV